MGVPQWKEEKQVNIIHVLRAETWNSLLHPVLSFHSQCMFWKSEESPLENWISTKKRPKKYWNQEFPSENSQLSLPKAKKPTTSSSDTQETYSNQISVSISIGWQPAKSTWQHLMWKSEMREWKRDRNRRQRERETERQSEKDWQTEGEIRRKSQRTFLKTTMIGIFHAIRYYM